MTPTMTLGLLLVATCCLVTTTTGYSFEERLPYYKKGALGSSFGYAAAMHKINDEGSIGASLFAISAPTDIASVSQPGTVRPGAVYSCPYTTRDDDCTRVVLDQGESTKELNKSHEWMGVTLKSKGTGRFLIACAHRTSGEYGEGKGERLRMCGRCLPLDGTRADLTELDNSALALDICTVKVPEKALWHRDGIAYAQGGISLDMSGNDDSYTIGGPGAYAWQGAVYNYDVKRDFYSSQTELFRTTYKTNMTQDSYNGFSVGHSFNLLDGYDEVVISGAPRYNKTGGFIIYKRVQRKRRRKEMRNTEGRLIALVIKQGVQQGSSYGYSLLVTDVNKDGLDDLLVGAPQYYQYSNAKKYGGAVYVYIKQKGVNITDVEPQVIYGSLDSAFGQYIATLGDFDQDGFNDVAISAPRDGTAGKVFVYRGTESGELKLSQTLDGAKFAPDGADEARGFGTVVSGGVDVDNNRYPDILIGTTSDFALHLRARPVIKLEANFSLSTDEIDLLEPQPCEGASEPGSVCFDFELCFKYEARHAEYEEELDVKYRVVFDGKVSDAEKRVRTSSGGTVIEMDLTLNSSDVSVCVPRQRVEFLKSATNRLAPVDVLLEYGLATEGRPEVERENPGDPLFPMIDDPILDADSEARVERVVRLRHDCGDDDVCESGLRVTGEAPVEVNVAKSKNITLTLHLSNDGEEAHQSQLIVTHPGVEKIYFSRSQASDPSISCFDTKSVDGRSLMVTCNVGNPYAGGRNDTIELIYDVSQISPELKRLSFDARVTTTSRNPAAKALKLGSAVIVEFLIAVSQSSSPKQVRYYDRKILGESGIEYVEQIGPSIDQTFYVKNIGKNTATGVELRVQYPRQLYNGKWLLYLTDASVTGLSETVGTCAADDYINELHKKLGTEASNQFALPRRVRRESPEYEALKGEEPMIVKSTTSSGKQALVSCDRGAKCVDIVCQLENIGPNVQFSILLKSRLWNYTFLEEFTEIESVWFETSAVANSQQSNVRISGEPSATIKTEVDHAHVLTDDDGPFPWWYILIGILFALIVYVIILFLLIKCGFFKRREFPDRHTPLEEEDDDGMVDEEKDPLAPHSTV